MKMNNYGCSLIYGHPQAPTAGRIIAEMLEEMVDWVAGTVSGPVALPAIPAQPWSLKSANRLTKESNLAV